MRKRKESNIDQSFQLSDEEESELLDRFRASFQSEMAVIRTVLNYMFIYEKSLQAEQCGKLRRSKYYLNQFMTISASLDLIRAAWLQSLDYVEQFPKPHMFSHGGQVANPIQEAPFLMDKAPLQEEDSLLFERSVVINLLKLENLIDIFQNVKRERNKDEYSALITACREAQKGWQTIFEQREKLLKMGGYDFFELFNKVDKGRFCHH